MYPILNIRRPCTMVGSELAFLGGSGFGLFEIMSPGFGPDFRSKITFENEDFFQFIFKLSSWAPS